MNRKGTRFTGLHCQKHYSFAMVATLLLVSSFCSFVVGGLIIKYYPVIKKRVALKVNIGDTSHINWNTPFITVSIPSSVNGIDQKAIYYKTSSESRQPLLVSLHTWSGTYKQKDILATYAFKYQQF